MKPIKFPTVFSKMTPRVDKSWKLEIETQELSGDDIRQLGDVLGSVMWIVMAPNAEDIKDADIPEERAETGLTRKSLSQRLYNTLFVYWKYANEPEGDFNIWREKQMNKLMDIYKSKMPERKEWK